MRALPIVLFLTVSAFATWFVVLNVPIAMAQPPALTSVILSNSVQGDYSRIRFSHTNHLGKEHINSTTLDLAADVRVYLAESAVSLEQQLIDKEAREVLDKIEAGESFPALEFATWSDVRALSIERKEALVAEIADLTSRKTRLDNEVNIQ